MTTIVLVPREVNEGHIPRDGTIRQFDNQAPTLLGWLDKAYDSGTAYAYRGRIQYGRLLLRAINCVIEPKAISLGGWPFDATGDPSQIEGMMGAPYEGYVDGGAHYYLGAIGRGGDDARLEWVFNCGIRRFSSVNTNDVSLADVPEKFVIKAAVQQWLTGVFDLYTALRRIVMGDDEGGFAIRALAHANAVSVLTNEMGRRALRTSTAARERAVAALDEWCDGYEEGGETYFLRRAVCHSLHNFSHGQRPAVVRLVDGLAPGKDAIVGLDVVLAGACIGAATEGQDGRSFNVWCSNAEGEGDYLDARTVGAYLIDANESHQMTGDFPDWEWSSGYAPFDFINYLVTRPGEEVVRLSRIV